MTCHVPKRLVKPQLEAKITNTVYNLIFYSYNNEHVTSDIYLIMQNNRWCALINQNTMWNILQRDGGLSLISSHVIKLKLYNGL